MNDGIISTASAPFGGVKESGLGREGGIKCMEGFLDTKHQIIGIRYLEAIFILDPSKKTPFFK